MILSFTVHPIDNYRTVKQIVELGQAPQEDLNRAEITLLVWATLRAKRDAQHSSMARQVYDQLGNTERMQHILNTPALKLELIDLILQWPK